jgi:hypothetical protein
VRAPSTAVPGSTTAPATSPAAPARAAADPFRGSVRLAPATPGSVRFTVTPASLQLAPAAMEQDASTAAIEGFTAIGDPGAAPRLERVLTVAVPPLGDVRLDAVVSTLSVHEGVTLAALPAQGRDGKVTRARSARAAAAITAGAKLLGVQWIRNQRVARIAIDPLAYDAAAHRLSVADRIDVSLLVQPLGSLGSRFEPDDPYEPVYRATLVNYDQGKQWRRPESGALASTAKSLGLPVGNALATIPDTSVLNGHTWVKLAVTHTGFYSVNFSALRNTALFGNDTTNTFSRLRLFTLPGYPVLPEKSYCDTCAMQEVSIGVANDAFNDGVFGNNADAFFFFAQGPSGWASDFDPSYADTVYINHPYETKNYYYLTIDNPVSPIAGTPQRMTMRDATPTGTAPVVTTFPDRIRFEEDHASEYWPDAGPGTSSLEWEKWFWVSMDQGGSFDFSFDVPEADTTQGCRFRLRQWGITDNKGAFNGQNACYGPSFDHYLNASFNSVAFPQVHWDAYLFQGVGRRGVVTFDTTGTLTTLGDEQLHRIGNKVHLDVPRLQFDDCPDRIDRSALAWFEIYYQHLLQPHADTLVFRSPGASGPYEYDIGPFVGAAPPRLFDVTNSVAPVEIHVLPSMWNGSTRTLSFEDTASVVHRYRVFPDSVLSIARMASTSVSDAPPTSLVDNLRSHTNGADYVIIYFDEFQEAAQALADARSKRLPGIGHGPPYVTKTIPISALYDQFSGGRTDPNAIRECLRAAYFNWKIRPRFVMFLGDASYDFKDYKGQAGPGRPGCLLPTSENNYDFTPVIERQFSTDDRLATVTDASSPIPDYFIGRIPADDETSALAAVRKLVGYESAPSFGESRNTTLLLADDDLQGADCDGIGWGHLQQTNDINLNHIPPHEDRNYVYLHTFATGPQNTKPEARSTLKADLNQGVSIFNYIGHGSPFKITDESVFIDTDAGSLSNANKLFLFVAASCDVGKFNDPTVVSLGEALLMAPTTGAVAVISATEQALSSLNVDLAKDMYDAVFARATVAIPSDTLAGSGQYHVPIGAALVEGKIRSAALTNGEKYQVMGDPATLLNAPHWWADVTLKDVNGAPLSQVQRGQTVQFDGQVLDEPGGSPQSCNGNVNVLFEDSAPTNSTLGNGWDVPPYANRTCSTSYPYDTQTYRFSAGPMYHGNVSVTNGQFHGRFVVPMDATLGGFGRARAYVQGRLAGAAADTDGVGSIPVTVAGGTPDPTDHEGPRITLSFAGGTRAVHPDATLNIDLFDQSGIMTTGHAPQNSIIVTLDGNTTQRTNVTASFRYAADSYQHGTATYVLPGVKRGPHTLSVQAADNLATGITATEHRSSATISFEVVDKATLHIDRAFVFPNPIRSSGPGSGGTFVINVPGDSLNTLIRIYTISGRAIRTLHQFGGLGQVQIPWDGRDAEGDPLANGTYLFKVYANVREADGSSSAGEEDAAVGKFVVVNR